MSLPERPVLVAPDSFKGTFRAAEVAGAIGRGLERAGLMPPDLCPLADGGEGTMEALLLALGGETVGAEVQDPLGRPVQAAFGLVEDGGTAVLEMAPASGLGLVAEAERDAWAASTYGTGELICAAVDAGAQVVLVGVGGSATTDGGAGAIDAIEEHGGLRRRADRRAVRRAHAVRARAGGLRAAEGRRRRRWSGGSRQRLDELAARLPRDPRGVPMTGAAGGLSGGLWAAFGAALEPGAPFDPRRARLRRAHARRARGGDRRGQARRADAARASSSARSARARGRPACRCTRSSAPTALDAFGKRIIDLQLVQEATDLEEMEAAGERSAAPCSTAPPRS